jgi:hypothetical protein
MKGKRGEVPSLFLSEEKEKLFFTVFLHVSSWPSW